VRLNPLLPEVPDELVRVFRGVENEGLFENHVRGLAGMGDGGFGWGGGVGYLLKDMSLDTNQQKKIRERG
jgi:hypothetical protein